MLAGNVGHKHPILATAYKLLRVTYLPLRDDRPYREQRLNYQMLVVERDAARRLR